MAYKKSTKVKGALRTPVIEEVTPEPKSDVKARIRYRIQEEVGDREDIIADNAKMISLLLSVIGDIWSILPDEQKNILPEDKVSLIDYGMNKFKDTTTLGDLRLSQEGSIVIDKLLNRQGIITDIIVEELS